MKVLLLLLMAASALGCNREDCQTGLSVTAGAGSACAAIGGAVCAFTLGIGCIVAAGCGVGAAVAGAATEACR